MAAQSKLVYFNLRARAEFIRILFHAAGQTFVDERVSNTIPKDLKQSLPFGQLPALEIDGKYYGQSFAIANYVARQFGLYGKTNLDALKIDQIAQQTQSLISLHIKALYEIDPAVRTLDMIMLKEEIVPKYYNDMEKLIKANNTGYFVGSQLSLADIVVFDRSDDLTNRAFVDLDLFPNMKAHANLVSSRPNVAKYLKERELEEPYDPFTSAPIQG